MKKVGLFILMSCVIASCGTKHEGEGKPSFISNFVSITDNEDKGVKEILELYGGQCKYAVGFENSKRYFELELSGSDIVEKQSEIAEMTASNVAYTFYKNLKDEKNNYVEIRTVLVFADSQKLSLAYPTRQLELIQKKMQVASKIVELIKKRDYTALRSAISDDEHLTYDKDVLIENMKVADIQFGNVTTGFTPYGFRIQQAKNGMKILHISGAISRDKQGNEFSIDTDLNGKDEKVFIFQYKL
jgi:hypothetical protein